MIPGLLHRRTTLPRPGLCRWSAIHLMYEWSYTHPITGTKVLKGTGECAGERCVTGFGEVRDAVPVGVYFGADESAIALPANEGKSAGGEE